MELSDNADPNDISALFKLYIRELPEPLTTFNHYDHFFTNFIAHKDEEEELIKRLKNLISELPHENRLFKFSFIFPKFSILEWFSKQFFI